MSCLGVHLSGKVIRGGGRRNWGIIFDHFPSQVNSKTAWLFLHLFSFLRKTWSVLLFTWLRMTKMGLRKNPEGAILESKFCSPVRHLWFLHPPFLIIFSAEQPPVPRNRMSNTASTAWGLEGEERMKDIFLQSHPCKRSRKKRQPVDLNTIFAVYLLTDISKYH